jgi:Ca2+-binding EF-hand superfamily protein
VLLNSAGYSRAELPLDDSVSIIAPNNTGKTSLINALQFLLILNKQHMEFGAHSFENTRRFYFPDNSAYILLEVLLPSGMAVIGCVGKGLSHDYEYFAYQGSLDLDDYRLDDGKLVTQPQLIGRLFECGKPAKIYPQAELRALLYGNRQKQRSDDPDFTIFPLEFTSQAATYQRILTRTLRLDRLDSKEVKNYLLEIFKNDLQDRRVDFKSEWDKSFADVNYDKSQYDAVFRNQTLIADMEDNQQTRRTLRGKIILWRPVIEQGLYEWEAYYNNTFEQLTQQLKGLVVDIQALENRQKAVYKDQAETDNLLKGQQKIEQHCQELTLRFEFVSDLLQLQNQRQSLQEQRDERVRVIKNAEQQQSPESIKRNLVKVGKEHADLQRQLASLNNNLYLQLQKLLPTDSFELLTRLLAKSVLSLPATENSAVKLDNAVAFQSFAAQLENNLSANRLELPGLSLDLSALEANLTLKTAQELETEISDCKRQLVELQNLLQTVETLAEKKRQQQELERQIEVLDADITDYKELLLMQANGAERLQILAEVLQKLEALKREELTLTDQKSSISQQQDDNKITQKELQSQHQRINNARHQRLDQHPPFTYLEQLPFLPCMEMAKLAMPVLADRIESYNRDCQKLNTLDDNLNRQLMDLHRDGLNKFQTQDSTEQELDALFAYTVNLSQEQAAIERKARSAVVQIAAILRDLRDSLETLKRRMREFNNKINRRQLSDLKVFKIEPREEEALVKAIQTLISTSEQVESGNSFDLFDHNAVLDDKELNHAKDTLIKEGEARGGLRVEHLFRLVFIIAKENQTPAEFEDIDSAASNGTVLMAKLITGLAMLNQMQDPRKTIKTACYLDEAASLDQHNQRNLIEIAAEFGFTLIFASPEPQITARYCVPIGTTNGKNHISRLNWQILEPINNADLKPLP